MQNSSISGRPVLLQVNYDSGHSSGGKMMSANKYAFALWQAGVAEFQPDKN